MKTVNILAGLVLLTAQAAFPATIKYVGTLSSANESGVSSPGTGITYVTLDTTANTIEVFASFSGLTSNTTASHIHCCTSTPLTGTAGVATETPTFSAFPIGVTSGSFDEILNLTVAASYNPAFVSSHGGTAASAEAALIAGLASGNSYLNIHTKTHPGGEINAFLATAPEPTTWFLSLAMLPVVITLIRRSAAKAATLPRV